MHGQHSPSPIVIVDIIVLMCYRKELQTLFFIYCTVPCFMLFFN